MKSWIDAQLPPTLASWLKNNKADQILSILRSSDPTIRDRVFSPKLQ